MNTPYLRILTNHITNPVNDKLTIRVMDKPGAGGANHRYVIEGFNLEKNPSWEEDAIAAGDKHFQQEDSILILFQNGPIAECGVNGITQEVLLAIVIDRLRCFQAGKYACEENEDALKLCQHALERLKHRTQKRMERGVEGTHTV